MDRQRASAKEGQSSHARPRWMTIWSVTVTLVGRSADALSAVCVASDGSGVQQNRAAAIADSPHVLERAALSVVAVLLALAENQRCHLRYCHRLHRQRPGAPPHRSSADDRQHGVALAIAPVIVKVDSGSDISAALVAAELAGDPVASPAGAGHTGIAHHALPLRIDRAVHRKDNEAGTGFGFIAP